MSLLSVMVVDIMVDWWWSPGKSFKRWCLVVDYRLWNHTVTHLQHYVWVCG